jgi:hypothetical protein
MTSPNLGWGGACAGQALGMCTLDLSQARAVTATFASRRVPLTLRLTGSGKAPSRSMAPRPVLGRRPGRGVVECVRLYEFGALVTLQGAPGAQTEVVGLGGDCTGAGVYAGHEHRAHCDQCIRSAAPCG